MTKEKTKRPNNLKPKEVDGRIEVIRASKYRGVMVYIRKINQDIFEYLIPHNGEIYANYIIITPEEGFDKLSDDQQNSAVGLIYAGAETTIDTVIFKEDPDEKTKAMYKEFEKVGKKAFNSN